MQEFEAKKKGFQQRAETIAKKKSQNEERKKKGDDVTDLEEELKKEEAELEKERQELEAEERVSVVASNFPLVSDKCSLLTFVQIRISENAMECRYNWARRILENDN